MESRRPRDEFTLRKWQQESMSKVMSDYLTDVCNHDEAATVATHHARFLSETCVSGNKMDQREMSPSEGIFP